MNVPATESDLILYPDMAGALLSPADWVIDRFQRTMTVYGKRVSEKGERVVTEHEVYQTPLLPGFELPLARILAAADAWS